MVQRLQNLAYILSVEKVDSAKFLSNEVDIKHAVSTPTKRSASLKCVLHVRVRESGGETKGGMSVQ